LVVRHERGSRGRLLQDLLLHVQTRRTVINSSPSTLAQCILCIMAFVGRRPDRWVGRCPIWPEPGGSAGGPCPARPGQEAWTLPGPAGQNGGQTRFRRVWLLHMVTHRRLHSKFGIQFF
jgi:hypothetical protein